MADGIAYRLAPWSGVAGGALAWALQYQFLADLLHFGCPRTEHVIGLVSGIAAATLAVAAGLVSRQAWHAKGAGDATETRRFIAHLGMLAAAFAFAAIVLQTAATLILPPCVA